MQRLDTALTELLLQSTEDKKQTDVLEVRFNTKLRNLNTKVNHLWEHTDKRTEAWTCKTELSRMNLQDQDVFFPSCIYSYKRGANKLFRTILGTGKTTLYCLGNFKFLEWSSWAESNGVVFITGGGDPSTTDAARIHPEATKVVPLPHMLSPRRLHSSVVHTTFLYVIGGYGLTRLKKCERFDLQGNQWTAITPLPHQSSGVGLVVLETTKSLYALGGRSNGRDLDLIQQLCLEILKWTVMPVTLPIAYYSLACFKLEESQLYIVVQDSVYSYIPSTNTIRNAKLINEAPKSYYGPSYYVSGRLYCSSVNGPCKQHQIGSLTI